MRRTNAATPSQQRLGVAFDCRHKTRHEMRRGQLFSRHPPCCGRFSVFGIHAIGSSAWKGDYAAAIVLAAIIKLECREVGARVLTLTSVLSLLTIIVVII